MKTKSKDVALSVICVFTSIDIEEKPEEKEYEE